MSNTYTCPVCRKESTENKCKRCGFETSVDFISKEDANKWFKDKVLPYREKWLNTDYDGAIKYYSEAIRLDPSNVVAYIGRGIAYWYNGDLDMAIADYTEAIRLDPNKATVYYNRGIVYKKKGDYTRAIADYTDAIRKNPNYTAACFNRGVAYYNKKDYALAIADFESTLQIDPNHPHAKKNIELARQALIPTSTLVPTPQLSVRDSDWAIEDNESENDFEVWYGSKDWGDGRRNTDNLDPRGGYSLPIYLSREDFIFTIGYDGPKAVIDTYSIKKYGSLSTLELAEKGLFRAAFSSAVYSENQHELNKITEIYNRIAGTEYRPDDLYKLFGIPKIIKKKRKQ